MKTSRRPMLEAPNGLTLGATARPCAAVSGSAHEYGVSFEAREWTRSRNGGIQRHGQGLPFGSETCHRQDSGNHQPKPPDRGSDHGVSETAACHHVPQRRNSSSVCVDGSPSPGLVRHLERNPLTSRYRLLRTRPLERLNENAVVNASRCPTYMLCFLFASPLGSLAIMYTGVRCVPPLIAMCKDHESLNLQQFEGLMALTNLASLENVRSRIIAEKGISCFHFLQVMK